MTAALLILWALLFAIAPTYRGERAANHMLGIIRPEGPVNRDGSTTAFAHVQEKGEFRLAKLGAIAAGLPFLWLDSPVSPFLAPLAIILGDQLVRSSGAVDYAGHAAEIMAAEDDGAFGYREAEIARMSDDGDKRGHNIAAMLLRWEWLGRVVYALGRV